MRSSNLIFLTIFSISCCISQAHDFPGDFLNAHNKARAEVGVPPLRWNKTLAAYAKIYAKSKIIDCKMEHSNGPYGENLAEASWEMNNAEVVDYWITEKDNYDRKSGSCVKDVCGHYTQIIWRDTFQVGCAKEKCTNGWMFAICNYYPPGNVFGQRPY
ncbi:hypothetical protein TanjilG_00424 [Lupinus angustifolius]|uniref:SCP domain-containing protein n=1 Tax=Lupinus angustifolius TaxID=3871 RepID=A0A1J7I8Q8_LUPAN|nr:PREDICTED: basic form of pathogenesis-related protein 1-like [Lupinus angustifolius]XP_019446286.1 PREDICTED: basic form of pathogenesis-related protein 1-like [Lupinus angustifolius]OIW10485.1 hypothetical protein TanjilG_00423 [Lupinus angustifolius]OIW10486.1 hypothetical protein TanjilG_00424 [Lupinus angustifolius]